MGVTGFVIIVVLLIIILMQIKDIKKLIIPVRKGIIEISSLVVILLTFGGIIIFFGRKWSHYLMCLWP